MSNDNRRLKRALTANVVFSGITGLGALGMAGRLSEALGPPAWSLRALGAALLVFAALVAHESLAPGRAGTLQIIAADMAWVVTAGLLIAIAPGWLTDAGRVTLTAVTSVVGAVAAAQWRGLGAMGSA